MKAAVLTGYDKNGRMLEIRDVPVPEMKDNVSLYPAGGATSPLQFMLSETAPFSIPFHKTHK